jgi:hypothetical protein
LVRSIPHPFSCPAEFAGLLDAIYGTNWFLSI